MGSIRFTCGGTRSIVAVNLSEWRVFLQAREMKHDLPGCRSALKKASVGMLTEFADGGGKSISALLSRGDAVYMPPGWMLLEKTWSADLVGVRCQFIDKDMVEVYKSLATDIEVMTGKPHEQLQAVLDLIALEED